MILVMDDDVDFEEREARRILDKEYAQEFRKSIESHGQRAMDFARRYKRSMDNGINSFCGCITFGFDRQAQIRYEVAAEYLANNSKG